MMVTRRAFVYGRACNRRLFPTNLFSPTLRVFHPSPFPALVVLFYILTEKILATVFSAAILRLQPFHDVQVLYYDV